MEKEEIGTWKTSLDRFSKAVTIFYSVVALSSLFLVRFVRSDEKLGYALVCALVVFVWLFTFFTQPLRYLISDNSLIIKMRGRKKIIPLSTITGCEEIKLESSFKVVRLFGNGGLFGYTGYFYLEKVGKAKFFCGRLKNLIVITTKKEKIVVSPDYSTVFIDELSMRLKN